MQPIHQHHKYGDNGQATVELAVVLPFIVLLAAAFIQCGLIVADQLAVWNAARSAARAAVISADPELSSRQAARAAVTLRPLQVTLTIFDDVISAQVTYIDRTDLPFIGLLFPNITLAATVVMPREIPNP
ncbi:MAG: TadE family protein [Ilumatobacteraceae bacterium]